MSLFDLATCARRNILALQPYHCARDEYEPDGSEVFLDLNENANGPALPSDEPHATDACNTLRLHRYPDRLQVSLKERFCMLRNSHLYTSRDLSPENIFLGVGSIEAIDVLIRCFCTPGQDAILTCPPTYGMYGVSAKTNDVRVFQVPLRPGPAFALDVAGISRVISDNPSIKIAFFASPGNPTGSLLSRQDVESILAHPTWNGVVVLDEAYIDFAHEDASLAGLVADRPNLVVLQTLSKAFGMAGIRVGAAFAPAPIAALLNNLKAPWNVPSPSGALAAAALSDAGISAMHRNRASMKAQRARLMRELPELDGIGLLRGGADSNFLLVEVLNARGCPDNATAKAVYANLAESKKVIIRYRGTEPGCFGCVRFSVGTEDEVTRLLDALRCALAEVRKGRGGDDADSGVDMVV